MKRGKRQDAAAIQIRLNIIFLIISILCLLSIKVRSADVDSKWAVKTEGAFEADGGNIEIKTFGLEEIDLKDVQPGSKFFIRAGNKERYIDLRSPSQPDHLNPLGFRTATQDQYSYKLQNANIRKPTPSEFQNSGIAESDGYYVLEVLPDLTKIKEPVVINMQFKQKFRDTLSLRINLRGQFNSWLKLNPTRPVKHVHTISIDKNISANQEYKGTQKYMIDYDTFTFGSASMDITSLCRGSALTSEDPCIVPGVVDQNSRIKATLKFVKEGRHLRIYVMRANYDGKLLEVNGHKYPIVDNEYLRRHNVVNKNQIQLRIPMSLSNKAGDRDVSGMILNLVDFVQPDGTPPVCEDPTAIDINNKLFWLSELKDAGAALQAQYRLQAQNDNGNRAVRVDFWYKTIVKTNFVKQNWGYLDVPGYGRFISVKVDSLENFGQEHVDALAEAVSDKFKLKPGAVFFTKQGSSFSPWIIIQDGEGIRAETFDKRKHRLSR